MHQRTPGEVQVHPHYPWQLLYSHVLNNVVHEVCDGRALSGGVFVGQPNTAIGAHDKLTREEICIECVLP